MKTTTCPYCHGKGKIKGLFLRKKCTYCNGTGKIIKSTYTPPQKVEEESNGIDLVTAAVVGSILLNTIPDPSEERNPEIVPGGGEFSGAGASGSYDEDKPQNEPDSPTESECDTSSNSGSSGGSGDD